MSEPRKNYWDSTCFICFLNRAEAERRKICEDILYHAQRGELEIWTSTLTAVEVIRPRKRGTAPLPEWAKKAIAAVPEAQSQLPQLWERFQSYEATPKLTPEQITKIQQMFEWPFIKKIYLDERVAAEAVKIARDHGLRPADAVHAASAILRKCAVLQKWDKDFDKVKHLIPVEEPALLSAQGQLIEVRPILGPVPEDFENAKAKTEQNKEAKHEAGRTEAGNQRETDSAHPPPVQGSDSGRAQGEAASKAGKGKEPKDKQS